MTPESQSAETTSLRERFPRRIRHLFLGVVVPLTLLPILIIGGIIVVRARILLLDQVNAQLNSNIEILATEVDAWSNTAKIRLDAGVRQPSFGESMEALLSAGTSLNDEFAQARAAVFTQLTQLNTKRGNIIFDDYLIINTNNQIMAATNTAWEGLTLSPALGQALRSDEAGVFVTHAPDPFSQTEPVFFVHIPFYMRERPGGYVVGLLNNRPLQDILDFGTQIQHKSRTYIITGDDNFIQLHPFGNELEAFTPSLSQQQAFLPVQTEFIHTPLQTQHLNTTLYSAEEVRSLTSFVWLPKMDLGLVLQIPQVVAFEQFESLTPFIFYLLAFFIVVTVIIALVAAELLPRPILLLTDVTRQFSRGNWEARMPETRRDEIGLLSYTFNQMANELSTLYRTLSTQVEEQTLALQKRSSQFEATARVARDVTELQDLSTILDNATHLISEHFGFYHAGIFLLDDEKRFAVLQSANSEGGQRMLARGHRLEVGETGVVGRVADTRQARIALDVGEDRYYFDNPDLPETRSEMALPLIVQDEIIGVLDVQSRVSGAFTNEDIEVLQIMAEQIALAIASARLHEESAQTIEELQMLYGAQISKSWRKLLGEQTKAYQYDRIRVKPAATPEQYQAVNLQALTQPEISHTAAGHQVLHIPIALRGQTLGRVALRRNPDEPGWTNEDVRLAEEVTTQISVALENARLLEESQRRAAQEELLSQTSARFNKSLNIDAVLQMAVRELGQLAGVTEATVQIFPDENEEPSV